MLCSGGQGEARTLQFVREARSAVGLVITQHRKADARELVGERADGLVVITALLDLQRPAS